MTLMPWRARWVIMIRLRCRCQAKVYHHWYLSADRIEHAITWTECRCNDDLKWNERYELHCRHVDTYMVIILSYRLSHLESGACHLSFDGSAPLSFNRTLQHVSCDERERVLHRYNLNRRTRDDYLQTSCQHAIIIAISHTLLSAVCIQ